MEADPRWRQQRNGICPKWAGITERHRSVRPDSHPGSILNRNFTVEWSTASTPARPIWLDCRDWLRIPGRQSPPRARSRTVLEGENDVVG